MPTSVGTIYITKRRASELVSMRIIFGFIMCLNRNNKSAGRGQQIKRALDVGIIIRFFSHEMLF